jgi:hypothetical protein
MGQAAFRHWSPTLLVGAALVALGMVLPTGSECRVLRLDTGALELLWTKALEAARACGPIVA